MFLVLFVINQAQYKADMDTAYAKMLEAKATFENAKVYTASWDYSDKLTAILAPTSIACSIGVLLKITSFLGV